MKSIIQWSMVLLVGICFSAHSTAKSFESTPQISVTGDARVFVEPDMVMITVGIQEWNEDILEAKKKSGLVIKRIIEGITALGVEEKDIQTDRLSISPRYKDQYTQKDISGYIVTNTMMITLSKPELIEELITSTLMAGANRIEDIAFKTSEDAVYREKARKMALKAARKKAENMAGALGQSIGKPLEIIEEEAGPIWSRLNRWSPSNSSHNIESQRPGIHGSTALGKITMRASVTVTFELK